MKKKGTRIRAGTTKQPQDATLRNVRAAKNREGRLSGDIKRLGLAVEALQAQTSAVDARVRELEDRIEGARQRNPAALGERIAGKCW